MIYYFIGIAGSGLSSLAKILIKEGHIVRGVDVSQDFYTTNKMEAVRIENFSNMNLKQYYCYIIGNAFVNHRVTKYLIKMNWRYYYYPDFLNEHFKNKKWLTISGTSGKTSSTKLLSTILNNSTSLIGDGSYTYGCNKYFILEACEYKDTFLNYHPMISLVLNVSYDHVDYFKTRKDYVNSFIKYCQQSEISIVNGDEFFYRAPNVITYGKNKDNNVVFTYDKGKVTILNKEFTLPIKSEKYAYNFVGVYLVSKLVNIHDYEIEERLKKFKMPARRYQKYYLNKQVVILDYAHHPNEIKTIYEALCEEYPNEKKICVFEPHTLSRLLAFKDEYKKVLSLYNQSYLFKLFSSIRENDDLLEEQKVYQELGFETVNLAKLSLEEGVVCFLGAGVIDKECKKYLKMNS